MASSTPRTPRAAGHARSLRPSIAAPPQTRPWLQPPVPGPDRSVSAAAEWPPDPEQASRVFQFGQCVLVVFSIGRDTPEVIVRIRIIGAWREIVEHTELIGRLGIRGAEAERVFQQ